MAKVARDTATSAVAGAVHHDASPSQLPGEPTGDGRCHVAVLFDLPIEIESFLSRLSGVVTTRASGLDIHVGGLAGKRIAAAICGPNPESPELLVQTIVSGHRPSVIVAAGQACGLVDSVELGDGVISSEVVDEKGNVLEIALHAAPAERLHFGRVVSLSPMPERSSDKRELAKRTSALAADQSSYRIGDGCRRSAVPFMAVRVVSETVSDDLPRDVSHLLAQKSVVAKTGALAGSIWRRPGSIKDMWRLKEREIDASSRLGVLLESVLT